MTHQEYEDFKNENKVSSLYVNTGDRVKDLMVEIYFEGFCEGYERAVYYLQEIGPSILGCDYNSFFERHLKKKTGWKPYGRLTETTVNTAFDRV